MGGRPDKTIECSGAQPAIATGIYVSVLWALVVQCSVVAKIGMMILNLYKLENISVPNHYPRIGESRGFNHNFLNLVLKCLHT